MKRAIALLFACLTLGLVVAGCGGGDDNSSDTGSGSDSGSSDTKEQPAPKADTGGGGSGGQVTMKDIKFNPSTVTVKAGNSVTWTNDDSVGHDVTADDFSSGDAGGLNQGDTFKHTFKKAGTFSYVCTVHPGMEGTVKVKKK